MTEDKKISEPVSVSEVQSFRYSGFWVRGAAHIIDGLIIGILVVCVAMPVSFFIGIVFAFSGSMIVNILGQFISTVIGLCVGWGYYILMTHHYQATLGKMAVGAQVLSENGEKLSLKKIIIRETIGKIVSGIIFGIGYIMAAFTEKKQGLHDMIATSIVVYKDAGKGPNTVVVWIVYVLYALIGIAFILIFGAMIAFFVFMAFNMENVSNGSEAFDIDQYEESISEKLMNELYNEMSEEYSIEEL